MPGEWSGHADTSERRHSFSFDANRAPGGIWRLRAWIGQCSAAARYVRRLADFSLFKLSQPRVLSFAKRIERHESCITDLWLFAVAQLQLYFATQVEQFWTWAAQRFERGDGPRRHV